MAPQEGRTYAASIVIPLRRQQDDWLRQCIRSALAQTVACDVVVVTAANTPPNNLRLIDDLAEKSRHLKAIQRKQDGYAHAINEGFEAAAADRVGLLLSDDWLEPTTVEASLALNADIVCTGSFGRADDGTHVDILNKMPTAEGLAGKATLERKASYLQHFFFLRKDAFFAVGGVDPDIGLTGPDDYDLIWCMLENGASVGLVEAYLYNKRDHGGERLTMRDAEAQRRDLIRIFDKHGLDGPEREEMLRGQSQWFGRRVQDVVREREARRRMAATDQGSS